MTTVVKGAQVVLHFALALDESSKNVIDSTFEAEPAKLVIGDGNLPKGFEQCLYGMRTGECKSCQVLPEDAFGQPDPNNIQIMNKEQFKEINLEEGLVVSFENAEGDETIGVIKTINDNEEVIIDFNHPLAGKTLYFRAKIIDITIP